VLIRGANEHEWHPPKTEAYESEADLRDMIAHSPSLLPGIDRQQVAVATELAVPAVGQADVVVVDPTGEITIVECKLAKNAEIRRWVIGQVFSYAAGLWQLGYEELKQAFKARNADLTAPFTGESDWDDETFRAAVADNLGSGAFRLVIAVDEITDELKRTVVFMNGHTVPELRLLALELRYAEDEGVQILLPSVYGEESAEHKGTGPRAKRQWDESSFLAELEARRGSAEAQVGRELIEWARQHLPRFGWGAGVSEGSFIPILDRDGVDYWPFLLWTSGRAEIQFRSLQLRPPFDDVGLRREFARRLEQIPGVSISDAAITGRPNVRLATLATNPEALSSFVSALDWFCETVSPQAVELAEG